MMRDDRRTVLLPLPSGMKTGGGKKHIRSEYPISEQRAVRLAMSSECGFHSVTLLGSEPTCNDHANMCKKWSRHLANLEAIIEA